MWVSPKVLESLSVTAFDGQPLSLLQDEQTRELGALASLLLIETGATSARRHWQLSQLNNLIKFARRFSQFWRERLFDDEYDAELLSRINILTREQLRQQVDREGALSRYVGELRSSEMKPYASSGSTGIPVQIYSLNQNARYNELHSLAQYFLEGRRLDVNRTFIKPAGGQQIASDEKIRVELQPNWLGNLVSVFKGGHYKIIHTGFDASTIVLELKRHPVGYLACLGSHMQILVNFLGDDISNLGIEMWLHHSDDLDTSLVSFLEQKGIVTRSNYSCSELGPIATQCFKHPNYYHVAHSNVIVQGERIDGLDGVSNLLVTHLHSYATPLIRYEVGDVGIIHDCCPCGHLGTTLSEIRGRKKNYAVFPDGSQVYLPTFSKPMSDIVSIREFFFEQVQPGNVLMHLVPEGKVSPESLSKLQNYLTGVTSKELTFEIKLTEAIDWTANPKKLPFIRRF